MPQANLTDAFIRHLPPHEKQTTYTDTSLSGFGVRCSGQVRTFILVPPNDRARRRLTLGRYGPGGITLAQARRRASEILSEITLGKHRPKSLSYAEALDLFIENHLKTKNRPSSASETGRLLLKALPRFGKRPLSEIATAQR